jgi:hypothetical protein
MKNTFFSHELIKKREICHRNVLEEEIERINLMLRIVNDNDIKCKHRTKLGQSWSGRIKKEKKIRL